MFILNNNTTIFSIIKFFIYVVVFLYLYLILYYTNSTIKLDYSIINKKFNNISMLTFDWLFNLTYIIYLYFLIYLKFNYFSELVNILFLFFLFISIVLNQLIIKFNTISYSKKVQPVFFIICFFLVILNILDYNNFIINLISIEMISILTFGFLSSVAIKNNLSILLYLWSSILSAIIITYSILILNLQIQINFFFFFIKLYILFKIGILPFGLWLLFFYKYILLTNLIYYLILMYVINIFFVFFFINTISHYQSNNPHFIYKVVDGLLNIIIIGVNFIFFIFFYNNVSFKNLLMLNTNLTGVIIYLLLFNNF